MRSRLLPGALGIKGNSRKEKRKEKGAGLAMPHHDFALPDNSLGYIRRIRSNPL